MTTTRSKLSTSSTSLLASLSLFFVLLLASNTLSLGSTALLVLAGLSLSAICLVVVARTTMLTWITVIVLLAFSGKRRRVLAHHGREITADVAMQTIKIMLKERQFVTVICATAVSLMAMAQATRF